MLEITYVASRNISRKIEKKQGLFALLVGQLLFNLMDHRYFTYRVAANP
jgi:hypothetical protein